LIERAGHGAAVFFKGDNREKAVSFFRKYL
jgi:hypothetical protein